MKYLTEWQIKWYPLAILATLAIVFLFCLLSGDGAQTVSGRLGGDFPAFYGAGRIVLGGDIDQLYDVHKQIAAQEGLLDADTDYLCFAYPPFFVLPYAVLAFFPYKVAYFINICIFATILFFVLRILFAKFDIQDKYFLVTFVIALFFYPIFRGLLGGQNTLLTLLLLCLYWCYTDNKKDVRAGICLGLMLFKPQFALPMIGLTFLLGRWKAVGSAIATGLALYLVSSAMLGFGWFDQWWKFANWFSSKDALVNGAISVSWTGLLVGVFGNRVETLGTVLSVVNAGMLSLFWLTNRNLRSIKPLLPVACVSLTLIPSRVIYYDSGLILLACFMLAADKCGYGRKALIVIWFGAYLQAFALLLGFSPMAFINVWVLALSVMYFYKTDNEDRTLELANG